MDDARAERIVVPLVARLEPGRVVGAQLVGGSIRRVRHPQARHGASGEVALEQRAVTRVVRVFADVAHAVVDDDFLDGELVRRRGRLRKIGVGDAVVGGASLPPDAAEELQVGLIVLIHMPVGDLPPGIGDGEQQAVLTRVGEAARIGVGRRLAIGEIVPVRRAGDGGRGDGLQVANAAASFARAVVGVGDAPPGEVRDCGNFPVGRAVGDGVGALERVDDAHEPACAVVFHPHRVGVPVHDAAEAAGGHRTVERQEFPIARVGEGESENEAGNGADGEMFVPPKQAVGVLPEHIRAAHAIADFHAPGDLLDADVVGEIPAVALFGVRSGTRAIAAAPDEVQSHAGNEQVHFVGLHFARGRDAPIIIHQGDFALGPVGLFLGLH